MREIGRPLDLALHGWGWEFGEAAARERQSQKELERESRVGGRASIYMLQLENMITEVTEQ